MGVVEAVVSDTAPVTDQVFLEILLLKRRLVGHEKTLGPEILVPGSQVEIEIPVIKVGHIKIETVFVETYVVRGGIPAGVQFHIPVPVGIGQTEFSQPGILVKNADIHEGIGREPACKLHHTSVQIARCKNGIDIARGNFPRVEPYPYA